MEFQTNQVTDGYFSFLNACLQDTPACSSNTNFQRVIQQNLLAPIMCQNLCQLTQRRLLKKSCRAYKCLQSRCGPNEKHLFSQLDDCGYIITTAWSIREGKLFISMLIHNGEQTTHNHSCNYRQKWYLLFGRGGWGHTEGEHIWTMSFVRGKKSFNLFGNFIPRVGSSHNCRSVKSKVQCLPQPFPMVTTHQQMAQASHSPLCGL